MCSDRCPLLVISDRENGGVIGILSYGNAGVRMEM